MFLYFYLILLQSDRFKHGKFLDFKKVEIFFYYNL
jgi:hypothetical protein